VRTLRVWDAGFESALDTFRADQAMMAMMAGPADGDQPALCRLWSRPAPSLSAGRFHRLPTPHVMLARRTSGGRVVPVGPGVLGVTLVAPRAAWLDPRGADLRPEQVLNRALRPLLATLRGMGVDAFYPGRDAVTVDGRVLAVAAFSSAPDETVVVEQLVSLDEPFSNLARLLESADPGGVAAVDPASLASSASVARLSALPARERWATAIAGHAAEELRCTATVEPRRPGAGDELVVADELAFEAFQAERGPLAEGSAFAAAIAMLGVVEASARVVDGRIHDLVLCGDLMAPLETLEAIAAACEGVRLEREVVARVVGRVLTERGRFVLGARDLDDVIARMA